MNINFETYNDFLKEYRKYTFHECPNCKNDMELTLQEVDITVDRRLMHFEELFMLTCLKCSKSYLPEYSKQMIDGCYKNMLEQNQYKGIFASKGYKQKFKYCENQDFDYDHKDYYNIPGLCHDDEHSEKGFLTPVYFKKKSLLHFMHDTDYKLSLFSETYGLLSYKDQWSVPFGININSNIVFWLGDLNDMDDDSLGILKPFNIESDHKLIHSQFYAAQMCCIFSDPNREITICNKKDELFNEIRSKYNIDLFHLVEEIDFQINNFNKPILININSIEQSINMLHKVLIEGVNIPAFKQLYLKLNSNPANGYKDWKSIKFYQTLLENIIKDRDSIRDIISPLYLLNDFRQYYDHLLSTSKRNEIKDNIVKTLQVNSFEDIEEIYSLLLEKLTILFEYLIVGYSK